MFNRPSSPVPSLTFLFSEFSWNVFNLSFQNNIIKGRISTKMAVVSKFTCNNKADLLRSLEDIDGCISSNDSESEDLDGARVHGQLSNEKTSARTTDIFLATC